MTTEDVNLNCKSIRHKVKAPALQTDKSRTFSHDFLEKKQEVQVVYEGPAMTVPQKVTDFDTVEEGDILLTMVIKRNGN